MNAVMTAENKPACHHSVLKIAEFRKGTHEHKEGVYVLLDICNSVFIDLTNKVVKPCPSRSFGFNSQCLCDELCPLHP